MRWRQKLTYEPRPGSTRTITKFLLIPRRDDRGQWRWLETATWEEMYMYTDRGKQWIMWSWVDKKVNVDMQLKPCPFCGHPGERKSVCPHGKIQGEEFYLATVGCSYLGCTAQTTQAGGSEEIAWKYAIALWNRRVGGEY